ncbi:MAG TPA: ATP-dependent RNA helicase HrpA, partial [Acidimicrobiales bacterium]|nr:ATP-dependent RNA helicase HrpA [Acidimicrobiales bacterium]
RLTRIGRRLARLPVEPRLGRMVLEADRLGCVREVLVVAAALSIIDPRERPSGTDQQRAAELHKRFDDPDSDFVAYLNLWAYLRELRHELSSNQFRKRVRAEHLNWLRVREWEDVHSQLRQIAGGLGVHAGRGGEPAAADTVHQALLAGLLSHIGTWDEVQQDYRGARQARFALGRGSSLAKAKTRPRWVMAGELVETNRLWGHTVARIRPEWIEQAAGEVAKRSYGDAWWDQDRAAAMVEERVSVFGLEVARRRVNLARVDEALARELFIFHALVLGEWDAQHDFLGRNAATIAAIEALEAKVRRRDLLVDPDTIYDLYDARLPATVTGGKAFDRWWRDHRLTDADRLVFSVDELLDPSGGTVSATDYPDVWPAGDLTLPLTYRFEPDEPLDGVTVDIPVDVLNRFDGAGLDWQVPGYRFELVTALVRSLPKPLRRAFVPVPDHVAAFLERAGPADGPLLEVLGRELTRMTGDRIPPDSWQLDAVPAHLRVTFRAVAADGRALAWSKDLDALRERLQPKVRAAVARSAPAVQHTGLTSWSIDPLPAVVESGVDGRTVTAYPALVDEGDTAGVRAFATADEAAVAHRAGLRRLLLLGAGNVAKRIRTSLPRDAELALASLPGQSVAQVVADVASAAVDSLITSPGKVRDREAFEALLLQVREGSTDVGLAAAGVVGRIAGRVADILGRVDRLTGGAMAAADDIRVQARGLVHPGFVAEAGIDRLRDIDRYLAGVQSRLDKLAADPAKDRRHMAVVQALEDEWVPVADRDVGAKVRWMLEELRVSLFAQSLGTKGSISEQRVRKAIAALSGRR